MSGSRLHGHVWRTGVVSCLALALAGSATPQPGEGWTSALQGRELIVIEKERSGEAGAFLPLPSVVEAALGHDRVDYESFVAVRLPAEQARNLTDSALSEGLAVLINPEPRVPLPFHAFDPGKPEERTANRRPGGIRPLPVPNRYLIRFAFPLREEWDAELASCGVEKVVYFGHGAFLVRAPHLGAIRSCPVAQYLSWAGPYLTTDRLSSDLIGDDEPAEHWLQFVPGTAHATAFAALPAGVEILDEYRAGQGEPTDSLYLHVRAGAPELEALAQTSEDLLTVLPYSAPTPSDERQGQILAGLHDGTKVRPLGASVPHYTDWLQGRGLNGTTNQQTVAVFDTGYDDGLGSAGHHLDLENPKRLIAAQNFVPGNINPNARDPWGHGTAVAGIIAGNGIGTGIVDSKGFYRGTGIAPKAKIVMAQIFDDQTTAGCALTGRPQPSTVGNAINFSRSSGSTDRAFISNHSWNTGQANYDAWAQLLDQRVLDADTVRAGAQPMTMVVSAANKGPAFETVEGPATAKNVIAVGSTQSYRPVSTSLEPDAPPLNCSPASTLPLEDALHIGKVSDLSSRGKQFPANGLTVLSTRIKPDVVAPGGRVFSTVPYNTASTYTCQNICRKYWPDPPAPGYHSYMNGTSFAAPVVSGMAALLQKWFLDRGMAPSPSLLKSALIATADDLGASSSLYASDHRPSAIYGWGRANLDRATDSVARFYVTDTAGLAVSTGGQQVWTRTIDNPSLETRIVVAWSDPANESSGLLDPPLVNDLQIVVEKVGASVSWRGNVLNEVMTGVDDGYSYTLTLGSNLNDSMNTVEAVFLPPNTFTAGQQVTIRVTGINVPMGPQKFSIYAYNVRP
jgi:serine protease AprX